MTISYIFINGAGKEVAYKFPKHTFKQVIKHFAENSYYITSIKKTWRGKERVAYVTLF